MIFYDKAVRALLSALMVIYGYYNKSPKFQNALAMFT